MDRSGRISKVGDGAVRAVLYEAATVLLRRPCSPPSDGRSVTTLVNATPIHAEDGAVASVVVTPPYTWIDDGQAYLPQEGLLSITNLL